MMDEQIRKQLADVLEHQTELIGMLVEAMSEYDARLDNQRGAIEALSNRVESAFRALNARTEHLA